MLDIIVVTHGKMSDGIKDAVNTIVGMDEGIEAYNLLSGKEVSLLGNELYERLIVSTQLNEVVILTDLVSASPYNQSIIALNQLPEDKKQKVRIIGGVNLPMVLEAFNHRLLGTDFLEAVKLIEQQGHSGIGMWQPVTDHDDEDDF